MCGHCAVTFYLLPSTIALSVLVSILTRKETLSLSRPELRTHQLLVFHCEDGASVLPLPFLSVIFSAFEVCDP